MPLPMYDGQEDQFPLPDFLNAAAMGGGLPAGAEPSGLEPAVGTPPFEARSNPMGEYQERAAQIYKEELKPRSRLEHLLTLIQPLARGFAAALSQPGYRRNRAFWGTLAGEGASTGLQEAARPRILKQQARQQALNEIYQLSRSRYADRAMRGSQTLHSALDRTTNQKVFITSEMQQRAPERYSPIERETPDRQPVFRERTIDEQGTTETYRYDPEKGGMVPVPIIEGGARQPSLLAGSPSAAGIQADGDSARGVPGRFLSRKSPKADTNVSPFDLWRTQHPNEPVETWMKFEKSVAKSGRQPTEFEYKSWLYDKNREKFNALYGDKTPKPKRGTPEQFTKLEQWKFEQFSGLTEDTPEEKQAIEDAYGAKLEALGGEWIRTIYGPDGMPISVEPATTQPQAAARPGGVAVKPKLGDVRTYQGTPYRFEGSKWVKK